jgi:GNAT superfamily N-acetyltransferase
MQTWTLRPPEPGDIGWIVERHGTLYAAEYGFGPPFEAEVAAVAADYLRHHDPARECCWIAERAGARLGSAFVVRKSDDTAKLRLVIVDPAARGLGIGKALVQACIDFARRAEYGELTLGTHDILLAARAIYKAAGFTLQTSVNHCDYGPAMAAEEWLLDLKPVAAG